VYFGNIDLQVLLVFPKEDTQCSAIKIAAQKSGFSVKITKNLADTCSALTDDRFDVIFIDCREALQQQSAVDEADSKKFDHETICKTIRKMTSYALITAVTRN
jgi:high affinity cAMP-specific and IBMX-insensitive 3',5'-cyclic phosphodiesterase 8